MWERSVLLLKKKHPVKSNMSANHDEVVVGANL